MKQDKRNYFIMSFIGLIPVIWLALLVAPFINGGLPSIIKELPNAIGNPFNITFVDNSFKTIFIFILIYVFAILMYISTRKNYKKGKEHGSAKWGDVRTINKKYKQLPESENRILTQNIRLGLNAKKHRRNLNTLVIGGSGAGKTLFYAKPNLLQASNNSYIVLDPKGEILRDTGYLLKKEGYEVKVLDLVNMQKSNGYNPFKYIKDDNDVQRLVTNLFKSTTPKGSHSSDPFWDTAAQMLLMALILVLKYEAPENEQNFEMVAELLRNGQINEDDDTDPSPLDLLFQNIEKQDPNHIAVKYYNEYHSGSGKTLQSIQVTLASRLEKFNLKELSNLTLEDEMDLATLGEKKTVLFALIPDNDTSFNFIVSMLYTQIFQQLFYIADHKYKGALPIPVHFIMDEFANVSLPDDFDKILATMRSRGVSVSIIIQNMAQLKALFEKQWESIVGNCDELLYLGGNEQTTHKYISELLGKETIDTTTYGKSSGRNGNYSTNFQIAGRELMTPDEVRMLENEYALLFIRGERPIIDRKFNTFKHKNFKYTEDGGYKPYIHQNVNNSIGTIISEIELENTTNIKNIEDINIPNINEYEIIVDEEINEFLMNKKTNE